MKELETMFSPEITKPNHYKFKKLSDIDNILKEKYLSNNTSLSFEYLFATHIALQFEEHCSKGMIPWRIFKKSKPDYPNLSQDKLCSIFQYVYNLMKIDNTKFKAWSSNIPIALGRRYDNPDESQFAICLALGLSKLSSRPEKSSWDVFQEEVKKSFSYEGNTLTLVRIKEIYEEVLDYMRDIISEPMIVKTSFYTRILYKYDKDGNVSNWDEILACIKANILDKLNNDELEDNIEDFEPDECDD